MTYHSETIVSSNRIIYTPSAFARSALLHLQETGTLHALKAHKAGRKNLDSFLCFVVIDGKGELEYSGERYPLSAGDCAFIDCRSLYRHTTDPKDLWTLQWCHFHGNGLEEIYRKYRERGGLPVFRPKELGHYTKLLDDLYELAAGSDYIRDMRINEKLNVLLTYLMEESWNPDEIKQREKREKKLFPVRKFLDQHFEEKISLDELADVFFINKYHLARSFKEQFGVSIYTYLQNVRITKAKQLLRFTKLSMEEISLQCGLGSGYYFSRVFKSVEGISPREYRNRW